MVTSASFISSGVTPTQDMLLIPLTSLDGLQDGSEFGGSPEEIFSKSSAALINTMQKAIASLTNPLGLSQAKPNPTGSGTDILNQNIAISWQYVANLSAGTVGIIPSADPALEVSFLDVYPASELMGSGSYSGASADSLAITLADLTALNAGITIANKQGNLADDQRDMLEALTRLIQNQSPVRSNSQQSSITAKTQNNATGLAIPANFVNDTTFTQNDLQNIALFSRTYGITHQYQLNHDTQAFDVRVA